VKNKQQRVSIVIPTYNSWSTLKDCLESIFRQKLQPTEVIVIDNASTDGTSKKINQLIGKNQLIKLIKNKKNLGVTCGRNRGIKEANKNSEFLFFFDHDMVADEKMLEELVKVAESNKKIGIVTPKIYYWERKDIIWSAGTDGRVDVVDVLEVEQHPSLPAGDLAVRLLQAFLRGPVHVPGHRDDRIGPTVGDGCGECLTWHLWPPSC